MKVEAFKAEGIHSGYMDNEYMEHWSGNSNVTALFLSLSPENVKETFNLHVGLILRETPHYSERNQNKQPEPATW